MVWQPTEWDWIRGSCGGRRTGRKTHDLGRCLCSCVCRWAGVRVAAAPPVNLGVARLSKMAPKPLLDEVLESEARNASENGC